MSGFPAWKFSTRQDASVKSESEGCAEGMRLGRFMSSVLAPPQKDWRLVGDDFLVNVSESTPPKTNKCLQKKTISVGNTSSN